MDGDDILLLGLLIFSVAMGFFFIRKKSGIAYIPVELLSLDERMFVDFLKKHRRDLFLLKLDFEPVSQKEITKSLNWSKSKTSAVALQLERKLIVKREKYGRTFIIELLKVY